MVGVTGIEPVTSSLSGTRSNQLSYTPAFENGGGKRDRTDDLLNANQALSQLSYTPRLVLLLARITHKKFFAPEMVRFVSQKTLRHLSPNATPRRVLP